MAWYLSDGDTLPTQALNALQLEFRKSDARDPATKGEMRALHIMLLSLAATNAEHLLPLQKRIASFDPMSFVDRESGRRSMNVELSDGRRAMITTEVYANNGETLVQRKDRVDCLEATNRELESELRCAQQAISSLNRRITMLEQER